MEEVIFGFELETHKMDKMDDFSFALEEDLEEKLDFVELNLDSNSNSNWSSTTHQSEENQKKKQVQAPDFVFCTTIPQSLHNDSMFQPPSSPVESLFGYEMTTVINRFFRSKNFPQMLTQENMKLVFVNRDAWLGLQTYHPELMNTITRCIKNGSGAPMAMLGDTVITGSFDVVLELGRISRNSKRKVASNAVYMKRMVEALTMLSESIQLDVSQQLQQAYSHKFYDAEDREHRRGGFVCWIWTVGPRTPPSTFLVQDASKPGVCAELAIPANLLRQLPSKTTFTHNYQFIE